MSDDARELLVREFPVEVAEVGDGRTLEARIVPYNTPAKVVDRVENGGTGVPYMESWAPGAFDRQSGALNRVKVWLNFEHQPGLQGIVGHGEALDSREDGLYGTFRMHDDADGNKALGMVREGLLTGISLEAYSLRHHRTAEGVVERIRGHLDKVSLCRLSKAAFDGAQVLAVRETPSDDEPEPDEPTPEPEPEKPSEAALALQRIGYEPLTARDVTRKPWVPNVDRFTDEEYEASCLITREGEGPLKERASLPILEPDGTISVEALRIAAGTLSGARGGLRNVTAAERSDAARKLVRYYRMAEERPPDSLTALAFR